MKAGTKAAIGASIAGLVCMFSVGFWIRSELQNFLTEDSGPTYELIADGEHLYVLNPDTDTKFDLWDGSPAPVQTAKSDEWGHLTVLANGQQYFHKSEFVQGKFWSNRSQALFFISCPSYGENSTDDLWRWTAKGGFEKVRTDRDIERVQESVDGGFLSVRYRAVDMSNPDSDKWVGLHGIEIIDKKTFSAKRYGSDHDLNGSTPINSDCVLVGNKPCEVWTLSANRYTPIKEPGFFFERVVFHDRVWGLRYLNQKYQVVRLSKDLKSFDKKVELPKDFPKAGPPGWWQE